VLSQREPGLWIATLGAAPSAGASVLGDPRFARARPYLESSPIAGAALGDVHFLAAAQPDPLDAWVAIDVPDGADALAQTITQQLARLSHEATTAPIAAQLHTSRPGATQIVVHLTGPFDGDLATAVRTVLAWVDAGSSAAGADPGAATGAAGQVFTCAAPTPGIACSDGTSYRVASLAADLAPIVAIGHPSPIVINGSIAGLRLEAAVRQLGLEAGDVIVAMAGRLVGSRTMLTDWIAHARGETSVTVRRGATEAVLRFAER
jgi:membrane-associated protease RseP (regulator of RpoE activity)